MSINSLSDISCKSLLTFCGAFCFADGFLCYPKPFKFDYVPCVLFAFVLFVWWDQCNKMYHQRVLLLLFSCSVVSDSLKHHGLQHTRLPCPSPSPGVCSNSCPLSWWCHPTISSSVVSFSSHLQSFPVTVSFLRSWLFASGAKVFELQLQHPKISFRINWFDLAV